MNENAKRFLAGTISGFVGYCVSFITMKYLAKKWDLE